MKRLTGTREENIPGRETSSRRVKEAAVCSWSTYQPNYYILQMVIYIMATVSFLRAGHMLELVPPASAPDTAPGTKEVYHTSGLMITSCYSAEWTGACNIMSPMSYDTALLFQDEDHGLLGALQFRIHRRWRKPVEPLSLPRQGQRLL